VEFPPTRLCGFAGFLPKLGPVERRGLFCAAVWCRHLPPDESPCGRVGLGAKRSYEYAVSMGSVAVCIRNWHGIGPTNK
jgi:hypothetical protein